MITIRKAKLKDYHSLSEMKVDASQQPFVLSFSELISDRQPEYDFYVISRSKELLGFFMLDRAYATRFTFSKPKELGLRNVMIDRQHQGKGVATQVLKRLNFYIYGTYPNFDTICLTVNKTNMPAYHCYLNAGFVDTGEIYYGGDAGPQHIMRKKITLN